MNTVPYPITHALRKGYLYLLIFAIAAPLGFLSLGLNLDRVLGNPLLHVLSFARVIGPLLTAAGLYFLFAAIYLLQKKGRGLPLSSSPPTVLVTGGPYAWARHPIYMGAVLLFAGVALQIDSFWGVAMGSPLLTVFYLSYARGIEEPLLIQRYGDQYRSYRNTVPLAVPFPFRRKFKRGIGGLLVWLSGSVNRPKLLRLKKHILFWGYGIWPGAGVMLGLALMEFLLLAGGLSGAETGALIAALTIFCLAGVRLAWMVVAAYRSRNSSDRSKGRVGFVSWGVLIGLSFTGIGFWAATGRPFFLLFDAAMPGLLLAHFFGRIGCMFYGCCFGKPADGTGSGFYYHHPCLKIVREKAGPGRELLTMPVQLYSGIYGLAGSIFIIVLWSTTGLPQGVPAALAMSWYGSFRIAEEWLREQPVIWKGFISPAQPMAALLFMVGLFTLMISDPSNYNAAFSLGSFLTQMIEMHFPLLILSGTVTALLFSYHYGEVGRWR